MNSLGVYFGPQIISIVESKGKVLLNNVRVLRAMISSGEALEEKVPEEIKMVPFLKDEFKKNKIEASEATVCLSGKDLIVRTFEMPVLPRQELDSAVNFEVKKYIPFKVEDLVSDYQCRLDKASRRNYVLFVGIKKDILSKYLSIFSQLNIKVRSIEYSAFSILRLLALSGIKERGAVGVVNIDLTEEDEVNFVVLENGFPLFSRDITFLREPQKVMGASDAQAGIILEKLKREIRISLDYYDRTFPLKNITKIFFVMDRDYRPELEQFIKDTGFGVQFINIQKCVGKPVTFSLSFVKGYCSSLTKVDTAVRIDLMAAKERAVKKPGAEAKQAVSLASNIKSRFLIPGVCILALVLLNMLSAYRELPLRKELDNALSIRPQVNSVSTQMEYDQLATTENNYKTKVKTMETFIKKRVYFTDLLNVIPRVVPKGMHLSGLQFAKDESRLDLVINGYVYLGDSVKELELVNRCLSLMKEDPILNKYFKEIAIGSIDNGQVKGVTATVFAISCKGSR